MVLVVEVLLQVHRVERSSCRRGICGASNEAPLPVSVVVRETSPLVEYPEGAELASGVTAIRVVRTSSGMAIGLSVDLDRGAPRKT